jgi:hypothetical protein
MPTIGEVKAYDLLRRLAAPELTRERFRAKRFAKPRSLAVVGFAFDRPFPGQLGLRPESYQLVYDHLMKP